MRNTQDNQDKNEEKRTVRKSGKVRASGSEARTSQRLPEDNDRERPMHQEKSTCAPPKLVMTEDEFRSRVSRKAYELYEKRLASTHVEDWLEAERLVKKELLAEGQWAGSV